MCGIVGFINQQSDLQEKKRIVNAMMDTIIHRGPNSSGEHVDEGAALGFRRLSIIDLEGGSQPIYNEDGTKVITFNGEIYNHRMLREELKKAGFDVTQATVSRDIKNLKLVKKQDNKGHYRYTIIEEEKNEMVDRLSNILANTVTSVENVDKMVVVKTISGSASAAAEC